MQKDIIILDNQDLTRAGILSLINEVAPDSNIIEVSTKAQLIDKLQQYGDAYVVLDYMESDITDSETLVRMADIYNKVQWLIISSDVSESMARRLSQFPTFGIIQKDDLKAEILIAFNLTFSRQRYICHKVMNMLLAPETSSRTLVKDLTPTEIQVLRLIALGKAVKEIAAERYSSAHTITTHKRSIFRKLHVNTSYEATKVALKAGIVDLIEYNI